MYSGILENYDIKKLISFSMFRQAHLPRILNTVMIYLEL